mmetsp:Transcript_13148/g.52476  ORF Transcript_13148/g.52476 Transcript_13148/m.52476 type:complete len:356 (+) Transcript_13148:217-1284(+)|eukprot:CAMPEP_0114624400 /NCGR_PEP_ID=MMETSP0168-20121206/10747_1 /TAXON_ID=95228 ORGANISM="Vannella sp., Strain DIVA3 517/6/12" /NCGR_SAMPLE_ID=MMETSP0168 /ASSEMBLY_ACC=CAM_ASM_000044 /LENGTH=355 /DNA_ID=CAMNT_0001835673 /DNA_START=168 /DNA_END=1235 /DNA_ORIENTATION=+
MSILDALASGDVDLDALKIGDLGLDPDDLCIFDDDTGALTEIVTNDSKVTMSNEEKDWTNRCLGDCRRIHAVAMVRFYVCKPGEDKWTYTNLYGAAAIVTEANLQFACAHFIRLVDLDGFNPNSSVMVQQELYPNFEYHELTPWFHAFEMEKYVAGLSFVKEDEALKFHEMVQMCVSRSAQDIVEDDYDSKEQTYRLVGDSGWRQANDSVSVKVARKYAGGGIADGTEVGWGKAEIPPEIAAALGAAGVSKEDKEEEEEKPKKSAAEEAASKPSAVLNLMEDEKIRKEAESNKSSGVGDGIQFSWTKNSTPLTGLGGEAKPSGDAAPTRAAPQPLNKKNRRKSLIRGLIAKKSKK